MTARPARDSALQPSSRSRACMVLAGLSALGLTALGWAAFVSPPPRIVYNPSDSVAVGWYRVDPRTRNPAVPRVGSLVLVPLPAAAATLAARRGYLPEGIPLLKPVAAIAPQWVCASNGIVRIGGVPVAAALRTDGWGRPLQAWSQCRRLRSGELFLLSTTSAASFDSRYFGPVSASAVLGVAHPVWREARR